MKKSKIVTVLIIVVVIFLVVVLFLLGSGKVALSPTNGIVNIPSQITTDEITNIPDKTNPDTMVYISNKLGIQFTYPKVISIKAGSLSNPIPTRTNLVSINENDNKLTVSAGEFGSYFALIFHKNSNETFEQSIIRQLVAKEYQNNPCFVKKLPTENHYAITFEGDIWPADGDWSGQPGIDFKKCSPYGGEFSVVTDPVTGGFYMATQGIQSPSFDVNSINWWPKGIQFIK